MLERILFIKRLARAANLELKSKTASKTNKAALRVLLAHLKIQANTEYDKLCRVAFLEGVAGFPKGSLIRMNPNMALSKLKKAFASEPNVNPSWFDNQDTGMFKYIVSNLGNIVKGQGLAKEPIEVINEAIMAPKKSPFYEAGEKTAASVLEGLDPVKSASRGLVLFLKRRALNNLLNTQKDLNKRVNPKEDEDGESISPLDNLAGEGDEFGFSADGLGAILYDKKNPLRIEVLQAIKDAGINAELRPIADIIIKGVTRDNAVPTAKQIHEEYSKKEDITIGGFLGRLQRFWAILHEIVKRDKVLQNAIKEELGATKEFVPFTKDKNQVKQDLGKQRLRDDAATFDSFNREKLDRVMGPKFDKFVQKNKDDQWLQDITEF